MTYVYFSFQNVQQASTNAITWFTVCKNSPQSDSYVDLDFVIALLSYISVFHEVVMTMGVPIKKQNNDTLTLVTDAQMCKCNPNIRRG